MEQFFHKVLLYSVYFIVLVTTISVIGAFFRPVHSFFGTESLYWRKHDSQVFQRIERQLGSKSKIKLAIVGSSVCYFGVNLDFFEAVDESEILYMCTSATSVSDVIEKSRIAAELVKPDFLLCEVSHRTLESLANEGRNRFIASAPLEILKESLPLCIDPFSPSRFYAIFKRSIELFVGKVLTSAEKEYDPATHMCNDNLIPNKREDVTSSISLEQKAKIEGLERQLSSMGTKLILFQSPSLQTRYLPEALSKIPTFEPTIVPDSCLPDNIHLTCSCSENFTRELSEFVTEVIEKDALQLP